MTTAGGGDRIGHGSERDLVGERLVAVVFGVVLHGLHASDHSAGVSRDRVDPVA